MSIWPPDPATLQRPAYRSLARIITQAIEAGELAPGTRLPTHRELAWQLGVSVQTVSRAYETLIRADIVSGQVGRGTFVGGQGLDRAPPYARLARGEKVVDCSLLQPVSSPRHARLMSEALAALAADLPMDALTSYRPRVALEGYTEAMAGWLRLSGVAVSPERIVATNGATGAMTVALMTATAPGDLVVTEAIGHHTLTTLMRALGLTLAGLPQDAEGIVPEAFERACRAHPVKALYAMPAGLGAMARTMSSERRAAICEIARRHDVMILENDAWGPLEPERAPPLVALAPERVLYFTGLGKCLFPGVRLGALVVPARMVEAARSLHQATNWMATSMVAEIGARWLRDGTAHRLLDWQRRALARRNRIAAGLLDGLDWNGAPRGLHVWLALDDAPGAEAEFVSEARARGVAVAAGAAFATDSAVRAPQGVRICLGGPSERQLTTALTTLRDIARSREAPLSPAG